MPMAEWMKYRRKREIDIGAFDKKRDKSMRAAGWTPMQITDWRGSRAQAQENALHPAHAARASTCDCPHHLPF